MIRIDGSQGEGGGQMLRSSLTLSLLTGQPFQMVKIRSKRPKPGLAAQHLACLRAAAAIGQAQVSGDTLASQQVQFSPGTVQGGPYQFRIETAGSAALVLQTVYLPLALRGGVASTITITGGTHVRAAPTFDYLSTVWLSLHSRLGLNPRLRLARAGFFPRGGGELIAEIPVVKRIAALDLVNAGAADEDVLPTVAGVAGVAGLDSSIAARLASHAHEQLRRFGLEALLREEVWPGGPGAAICLTLYLSDGQLLAGFTALGERGKPAERVADEAATQLLAHWRAAPNGLDPHAADQLLLPLALAAHESSFRTSRITQHLVTNAEIIRQFLSCRIGIDGNLDEAGWVTVKGVGR